MIGISVYKIYLHLYRCVNLRTYIHTKKINSTKLTTLLLDQIMQPCNRPFIRR